MSDYPNKLSSISDKKQKLLEEEKKLIEKRKKEIANLAERFGLLTASDSILSGLFAEARNSLNANDAKVKEWETSGARFLKTTKQLKQVKQNTTKVETA